MLLKCPRYLAGQILKAAGFELQTQGLKMLCAAGPQFLFFLSQHAVIEVRQNYNLPDLSQSLHRHKQTDSEPVF